ncbi:MAG TPA: DNA translocase FtsK 4TM domain-containing protein, partial [Steroidobacteraceae bacterium]
MAESTAQNRISLRIAPAVARGLRESGAIALAILALVLCVALLSFDPSDPGFSSTGVGLPVHNRIGPIGAWFADALFFLFGRPAYLLPVILGVAAWHVMRKPAGTGRSSRLNLAVRIVGFLLVLAASCSLAALHWNPKALPQGAGGVVGSAAGGALASGLNLLGATLLLLAAWLAGAAVAFGVSWLAVMDRVGAWTWGGLHWVRERLFTAREMKSGRSAKLERKEALQAEHRRVAPRVAPRIEAPAPSSPKSERAEKERQVPLFDPPQATELPPLDLLDDPGAHEPSYSAEALEAMSRLVELKLKDFGVDVDVVAVHPGPVVTRFEMRPAPGVKASQITALAKDLARALSTISVRVVEVIPGKSVMGLEIPNEKREIVTLGEIIRSRAYEDVASPLALALGKDIGGLAVVADLARMPHLLIAGTTGS